MLQSPTQEIEVDFLVFVERYASDLLKWDIITFFAHHPDKIVSGRELADLIGHNGQLVRQELGDLRLVNVLQTAGISDKGQLYRLTDEVRVRKTVLKFVDLN